MPKSLLWYLFLILFITSTSACAQNEKTITAKWKVRDSQVYEMEGSTFDISESGDTTLVSHVVYEFSVIVSQKGKTGYTLTVEYPSSIYTSTGLDLKGIGDVVAIDFATDEDGALIGVINTDYVFALTEQMMEEALKHPVFNELIEKGLNEEDMQAIVEYSLSPERILASFSKDIQVLLWPYGYEMEPGYDYTQTSYVAMGDSQIPFDMTCYMAPQEKGQKYTEIYMDASYDSDAVKPVLYSFIEEMMINVKEKGQYDLEKIKSESDNSIIEIVDSYSAAIDDVTTYSLVSTYTRSFILRNGEKVQETIETRTIRPKKYSLYGD